MSRRGKSCLRERRGVKETPRTSKRKSKGARNSVLSTRMRLEGNDLARRGGQPNARAESDGDIE